MKIILTCGDKINIPDGCKAEIKDGVITIEKEPKFKDGDIFFNDGVIGIYRNGGGDRIFYHCALMDVRLFLGENKPSYFGWDEDARLATDEEKEPFLVSDGKDCWIDWFNPMNGWASMGDVKFWMEIPKLPSE